MADFDPSDFQRAPDIAAALQPAAARIRSSLSAAVDSLPGPSPATVAMGGGEARSVKAELRSSEVEVHDRGLVVHGPESVAAQVYVAGKVQTIQTKEQLQAVRGAFLRAGEIPRVRIGTVLRQPPRDPYHLEDDDHAAAVDAVLDAQLDAWGFDP